MKKKKLVLALAVFIILLLAACSNTAEEAAAMEGDIPDISSGELLVSSLDYLLSGGERLEQEEELSEGVQEEVEKEDEGEPEAAGELEVTIYYGNGASDELKEELLTVEQVNAEELVDALIKHNIIPLGTKVNSFEEQESEGGKVLSLDLSKAFYEYLRTMTAEGEQVIMSSVVSTFLNAYDAQGIVITVDGKVLETEHAAYEEPLQHMLNGYEAE